MLRRAEFARDGSATTGAMAMFGDEEAGNLERRASLQSRLQNAVRDHVHPVFQPQIDLATGAVIGIEAFARWTDANYGVIAPTEFLGIAAQSQLMEPLTIELFDQALDNWRQHFRPLGEWSLSFNLAPVSLGNVGLLETLLTMAEQADLPAGLLTFDIPESALERDAATAMSSVKRLSDAGAVVSLDNFGSGYSSLSVLDRMPVGEIKIDRTLLSSAEDFKQPNAIYAKLITVCDDYDMWAVAEGVETECHVEMLQQLGCHRAQGYFFARPMAADILADWYRTTYGQRADHLTSSMMNSRA